MKTVLRPPPIQRFDNYNNAFGLNVPRGTSLGGTVKYLGRHTPSLCEEMCTSMATRCWSYVRTKASGACYGISHPGWSPSYDNTSESGLLQWPCRNDEDCSLNGKCLGGTCECRPAWSGHRCHTLVTLPANRNAGYRRVDHGRNTSSWGGAVLRGHDGLFHMWVSEITEHCGIGAWMENSRIVHATAATADGIYTRRDVTWPVFAHEPQVVPGPNGEFVMFFAAAARDDGGLKGWCNCCRPEHGPCDGSTGSDDCPSARAPFGKHATFMSWSMDPNGGWSWPVKLFNRNIGGDTNFSPLILSNGSLIGLWRKWGVGQGGSRIFLATADDWKNASSYTMHRYRFTPAKQQKTSATKSVKRVRLVSAELFPDLGASGTEDQFIYQDNERNFHAYFHNSAYCNPKHPCPRPETTSVRGHAAITDHVTFCPVRLSSRDPQCTAAPRRRSGG